MKRYSNFKMHYAILLLQYFESSDIIFVNMSDGNLPTLSNDNNNVDLLNPEGAPDIQELGFSAAAQKDKFLGGGGAITKDELESHRFRINEAASKKLAILRKDFTEFALNNPEVVGLTLFGSHTKGLAREDSDVDGYLFVNSDKADENLAREKQARVYPLEEDKAWEAAQQNIGLKFREQEQRSLGLTPEKAKEMRLRLISKKRIDTELTNVIDYGRKMVDYNSGKGSVPDYPKKIAIDQLFHLQIGKGLDGYRRYILDRLQQEGDAGEKGWGFVIDGVEMMERSLQVNRDNKLYPQTLEAAMARFNLASAPSKYPIGQP